MEEWLPEEKETAAADGGDKLVRAPLADGSLKLKRKIVEDDGCYSKSKKPKISKGKRKVDGSNSKGVINSKQKAYMKRTDPRFKRPLDWSLFETAADLEILGIRRIRSELHARGTGFNESRTLQERAEKLFDFKLDPFPDVNETLRWYADLCKNWHLIGTRPFQPNPKPSDV